jgi:hypothetical protein
MNEISEDTLAQLSRDLHRALRADGSWPRNMTARGHEARPHSATGHRHEGQASPAGFAATLAEKRRRIRRTDSVSPWGQSVTQRS